MDVISASLANILRQQQAFEQRLSRIEAALHLEPPQSETVAPLVELNPPPPAPAIQTPQAPPLPSPPPPALRPVPKAPPRVPARDLESNFGLTLANRIGAITLVLGIGFLFKYAVDNQYIGAGGRVMLGVLAGLISLGVADYFWTRGQKVFAQGVSAVGVSILYLSIYSAFGFYQLIPQPLAFIGMAMVTAMAGVMALRYNAVAIAALGLAGGFLTPVILSNGVDRPWFLIGYLLVLDFAALSLAKQRAWRVLEILSFVFTFFIGTAWYANNSSKDQLPATVFSLANYGLYATMASLQPLVIVAQVVAGLTLMASWPHNIGGYFCLSAALAMAGLTVADLRRWRFLVSASFALFWLSSGIYCAEARFSAANELSLLLGLTVGFLIFLSWTPWRFIRERQPARPQDLVLLALNGAFFFGTSYAVLNTHYHAYLGLFAVALAAVHLGLGYWLWNSQPADRPQLAPVLLSAGVAVGFLTLAVPIQFAAWHITMAWALEGAALNWIGNRLQRRGMIQASFVIFALAFLRLLLIDHGIYPNAASYTLLLNDRFLTFAITAVALWLSAYWTRSLRNLALTLYVAGHFVFLWTLSQEALGWAARTNSGENLLSVETVSLTILYAVYAVALVSAGVATRTAINRILGLMLMGFVVLKLYFFDVWQLDRLYRMLAFVALGVLLLSTSFLYSRFRSIIESWWKNDEART